MKEQYFYVIYLVNSRPFREGYTVNVNIHTNDS